MHLHQDHVFLRREALAHGYDDKDLRAAMNADLITRIRHGAYAPTDEWDAAQPTRRHQLRAYAVLRSHQSKLALSHTTAAIEHGLRLHDPDLRRIHVTCLSGTIGRTARDVVYHQGDCPDTDLQLVLGNLVVTPLRAGLESAALTSVPQGMVILDSLIDLKLADLDEIHRSFATWSGSPHTRRLQVTVRLTREGANSVGETLSRHLMWREHLPEPELQFEVRDAAGRLIGRADFAWPEYRLLGEFDGLSKYGRWRAPGETSEQVVTREKTREDRMREETGWLMIRLIWKELFTPSVTGARIREQLSRGRTLIAC